MSWHARGSLHYLIAQGERLGISRVAIDRAKKNSEIHRIATLLGQLVEQYHRLPRGGDGVPVVLPAVRSRVQGTLGQCEEECSKLHALAAASQAMIDEARAAFGLPVAERFVRVACDFDEHAPEPVGNGKAEAPIKVTAKTG